jgi:hypothetical protein
MLLLLLLPAVPAAAALLLPSVLLAAPAFADYTTAFRLAIATAGTEEAADTVFACSNLFTHQEFQQHTLQTQCSSCCSHI